MRLAASQRHPPQNRLRREYQRSRQRGCERSIFFPSASQDSRNLARFFRAETGTVFGTARLSDLEPQASGVGKTLMMCLPAHRLLGLNRSSKHLSREYTLEFSG